MKTVAIIQARMGSTRFPGKVMKNLVSKPVLWHVIERVRAAGNMIDDVVVATSVLPQDDIIEDQCKQWSCHCFRGDEQDVLHRYYEAASIYDADTIIRITADCPVIDSKLLAEMLAYWNNLINKKRSIDYLSNVIHDRTFPRGLDTEIFRMNALERAFNATHNPYDREHVTPYFHKNPQIFNLIPYEQETDFSHYRWTLDTKEDYIAISAIYGALYNPEHIFDTSSILELYKNYPGLLEINK